MTKEALFMAFDAVDAEMVVDADAAERKKRAPAWLRWGAAAACICLIAAGGLAIRGQLPTPGGGAHELGEPVAPGGGWPEGIDPITASIAVYPASEKLEDVASAIMIDVSEKEARSVEGLGEFLPAELPEGYGFCRASLKETVMNNGNTYHELMVLYLRGDLIEAENPDTPVTFPDDGFQIFMFDFTLETDRSVYVYSPRADDEYHYLAAAYPAPEEIASCYIQCGETFIGISPLGLSNEELHQLLSAMLRDYTFQEVR